MGSNEKLFIEGLFTSIKKLESHLMLNVPLEVISDVTNTIYAREKDGDPGELGWQSHCWNYFKQEHDKLIQEAQNIGDQVAEMKRQMEQA